MEEAGSADMMKLPEDMYDESMGESEEEDDGEEIQIDIRQARHILEEVHWEPDKLEDWQWDLLYRYVPSPERSEDESDKSYTTEKIKETVENFYEKKERSESVDEDNPIVEYVEGEEMAKKYPDVFTMYALVKMNVFKTKRQQHPPMTFGHCTYEDDDEGDEEADELTDEDEPAPSGSHSDEDEEEKHKEKKPAKERRKLKKKKNKEERNKLRDEVMKQKLAVETAEVSEPDQPSDISYLKREYVFLNEEDEQKIDELFTANRFKYYSPHERERTTTLPKNLSLGEEEPPINVAPSLKDLSIATLEKLNRTYYIHRVVYMFAYRTTDMIDDSNIEAPMTLKGYVAEQNTSYSVEYYISGCLFFYKGLAVVMVEGGENEIMRHFLEMRGSAMLGEFLHARVLYVQGHTTKRYFQHFVTCTADCTGPVEKIEKTKAKDIIQSFSKKMINMYKQLPKMGEIFKPGCIIKLPEKLAKTLPSIKQITFLLKLKVLRKLPAFVNQFIEVPYVSDSSDEAWPPQDYEIPYNILDQGKREQMELEKEMWAKVRSMKEKFKDLEKKRKKHKINNKKLIREVINCRKVADAKRTKMKEKKVEFADEERDRRKKTPSKREKSDQNQPNTKIEKDNKDEQITKEEPTQEKTSEEKTNKSILKKDNEGSSNSEKTNKVKIPKKDKKMKRPVDKITKKVKLITKKTVVNLKKPKAKDDTEWITDDSTVEH